MTRALIVTFSGTVARRLVIFTTGRARSSSVAIFGSIPDNNGLKLSLKRLIKQLRFSEYIEYLVESFASFSSELLLDDDEEEDFPLLRFELGFSRDNDRRLVLDSEL